MDIRSDEARVRQIFDEMTAGQPDAPSDRYSGIRRRARRHRLGQVATTLAAATAVAAVAVGIGTSVGRVPPAPLRTVPGWALPWPDHRNGSVPQRVLDGAVAAWRHQSATYEGVPVSLTTRETVIWYVGQTVAHGQAVAVIFEVESGAGRRLVAGWATASDVMHGQPGWFPGSSPWVLYDVSVPRPARGLVIGLNVQVATRSDRGADNWIVLLAAPQVRMASWMVPGPSGPSSSSESGGIGAAARGLVVADVGRVWGRVQVTQLNVGSENTLAHQVYVGVPGSPDSQIPALAAPAPIPGRSGFRMVNEFTGQATTGTNLSGYHGRLAIRARCYGPGRLRLTFGIGGKETRLGTLPCDDLVHELVTTAKLRDPQAGVTVHASPLTSYRVVLGTVR
jgi:hypothetical protein